MNDADSFTEFENADASIKSQSLGGETYDTHLIFSPYCICHGITEPNSTQTIRASLEGNVQYSFGTETEETRKASILHTIDSPPLLEEHSK